MKNKYLFLALAALCLTACSKSEEEDKELVPSKPVYDGSVGVVNCPDGNHPHAIDLGLPSGTKWSCCNLGAAEPFEFGYYYAWGATKPNTIFTWETYEHYKVGDRGSIEFDHLVDNIQGTKYDAAHLSWEGKWCMPTLEQVQELTEYCNRGWENVKDAKGNITKGTGATLTSKKNGAKIFMPAASYYTETGFNDSYGKAAFWTSNAYPDTSDDMKYPDDAIHFDITSQKCEVGTSIHNRRSWGLTIRPVAK